MLSSRSSPALVSAAAAKKLPRYCLFLVLFAFIAPRLFAPELWAGRDMSSFGISWSMLQGSFSDWLFPNIDGLLQTNYGPLTAWVSALFIKLLPFLPPGSAFHVSSGFWFAIFTASTWYGTYYLARRDEAQPLAMVFGGEAARKDYGRVIADIATLLLIGTYGTLFGIREITPSTTLLSLSALLFLGISVGLDNLKKGSIISGIAIGLASISSSFGTAVWFLVVACASIFFTPNYGRRTQRTCYTFLIGFLVTLIWPIIAFIWDPNLAASWFSNFIKHSLKDLALIPFSEMLWMIKNWAWALLPVWPFAIWGVYSWRSQLSAAHIAVPLAITIVTLISILFTGMDTRSTTFCLLPSLVALSAFGIATAKKSTENILDYFSGIVFSLTLIALWLYFLAWDFGFPVKMAHSIARLAPQVQPTQNALLLILAAIVTFLWVLVVCWRLFRHPVYLWRGAWLGACGITAFSLVFICLFNNLLDGARGMDYQVSSLSKQIEQLGLKDTVFRGENLSNSERAAFYALGNIRFTDTEKQTSQYEIVAVHSDEKNPMNADQVLGSVNGRPRSDIVYEIRKIK